MSDAGEASLREVCLADRDSEPVQPASVYYIVYQLLHTHILSCSIAEIQNSTRRASSACHCQLLPAEKNCEVHFNILINI